MIEPIEMRISVLKEAELKLRDAISSFIQIGEYDLAAAGAQMGIRAKRLLEQLEATTVEKSVDVVEEITGIERQ